MNVLHMKKGTEEGSYAKNSTIQNVIISMTNHVIEEAIAKILRSAEDVPDSLGVADLGCGSGPNTLSVVSVIIKAIHTRCRKLDCLVPELSVSLNDLPGNDFNSVFSVLEMDFYREMRVEKEVPPSLQTGKHNHPTVVNKGNVYLSKTSPMAVVESYVEQFRTDFKVFLESRSAEVVSGGRMVFSLYWRSSPHRTNEIENACFELLTQALRTLVSEGIVEEEKVDSFNVPIYSPCADELQSAIQQEGSFAIDNLESFEVGWEDAAGLSSENKITRGQRMVTILMAIIEALLESHFGMQVVNDIATTAAMIFDENPAKYPMKYVNIVASLVRK